jgi:hypothetical protein
VCRWRGEGDVGLSGVGPLVRHRRPTAPCPKHERHMDNIRGPADGTFSTVAAPNPANHVRMTARSPALFLS